MSSPTQTIAATESNIPGFSEVTVRDSQGTSPRSSGSRDTIPSEVPAGDTESGVEEQSLELAKLFMAMHGQLARKCFKRGELSQLYISTQASWMPQAVQDDLALQRPFKQILFALAHGLHVVRVVDGGRSLKWNRYRDNKGEKVEPRDDRPRRRDDRSPSPRRYDRRDRYDRRGRDRRGRDDRRERDDSPPPRRQRYERRR